MKQSHNTQTGSGNAKAISAGCKCAAALLAVALLTCGCQVLTYTTPGGEKFSRLSLGTVTAISEMAIESGSNGVRRVELRGYHNDNAQALAAATEAAVRGAIQGAAKP